MHISKEDIELILKEGEGYRIEFKEKLTNLDRELVAFANASGGRIFLGVTDTGQIKGIKLNNKLKSQIQDIANNCDPQIKILLYQVESIIIIEVREGTDKPYKCSSGFFNRIGPNAQKLSRNEIVEFIKAEGKIKFDELLNKNFLLENLSYKKLDNFLDRAKISPVLDRLQVLKYLGVCETDRESVYFNNTSVLFFVSNI